MLERLTIGTKEAAKILCVNQATVSKLCREGKLEGSTQDAEGSPWQIPMDSVMKRKERLSKKKTV